MPSAVHSRPAEIDNTNVTHVGKETVPGSCASTQFVGRDAELREGQTLAFTGLNQVRVEAVTESSVPVASSIPYIGSAFKSVKEEKN